MTLPNPLMTVAEFDDFVNRPENQHQLFEYIGGEIFEVPSNPAASRIATRISRYLDIFADEQQRGHVTGEAGGYMVSGERYAPDVAFISYEKQPILPTEGYNPAPPDLAVEVVSSDSKTENAKLTVKLGNYLAAGVVVWIVRPESQYIEVHQSGQPVKIHHIDDTIAGTGALDGFKLAVRDIFR